MKIKSAEFEVSAPDLRSCPQWALPEFALIGRSNVGKSSLINQLTGRRALAQVSNTPGKTKLINFFVINGAWSLVDLPGYGYAQVGQQRRLEFHQSIADFLCQRSNLRGVFVLIDARLPPQAIDLEFLRWLDGCRVHYEVVFTKIDKQSASQTHASLDTFRKALGEWRVDPAAIVLTSSQTGSGRTELLGRIGALLAPPDRSAG